MSTSHGINISQETYQSLERETLSESQSSVLSNQDISKDNSIISAQSQESHCLTISVMVESNSLDNASQKISPSIQEKVEKFEPDDIKRKAEFSPEETKKDKKK